MADPYLGMINMFGFGWAPRDYALCDGHTIPTSQNQALFSLFGDQFGGDGRTTFAVPDLQGRAPIHVGTAYSGAPSNQLGDKAGLEAVTLSVNEMPAHTHQLACSTSEADQRNCGGNTFAKANTASFSQTASNFVATNPASLPTIAGGEQAHENMQPFIAISFATVLQGIYPSRN